MADDRQNMQKMQRDAEQRLREMQRRADRAVSGSDMPPIPNFVRVDGRRNQQSQRNEVPAPKTHEQPKYEQIDKNTKTAVSNKGLNFLKMLNFKGLKFDKDIMLIIVMILLLSSDESDELLIYALIYIML